MSKTRPKKPKPGRDPAPPAGDRPAPDLPDVLAKDGPFQKALEAAREDEVVLPGPDDGDDPDDTEAPPTAADLLEALDGFRRRCRSALKTAAGGGPVATCVRALLRPDEDDEGETRAEALLRFCLLAALGREPDEDARAEALDTYAAQFAAFDHLLGGVAPADLRRAACDSAYAAGRNPTALCDWPAFLDGLRAPAGHGLRGMPTGLPALDRQTGGVVGVTLLAGRPGVGKSALAVQITADAVRRDDGLAALYVGTEGTKTDFYLRLLARESGVPARRLAGGLSDAEREAVDAATRKLEEELLPRVRYVPAAGRRDAPLTFDRLRAEVDRLAAAAGGRPVVVAVDCVQRMRVGHVMAAFDDYSERWERLTELEADRARADLLLSLHAFTRGPVLAVSRVRKDVRGRLGLDDVAGAADLVSDAHAVLLLEAREGVAGADVTPAVLTVAKAGAGGAAGDVPLEFHRLVGRFREPAAPPAGRPGPNRYAGK